MIKDDLKKYLDLFISDTEENLQLLNSNLLLLEKDLMNHDILNELMRAAHTIKGTSATMGFQLMADLTHALEDIFDYARNDKFSITTDLINRIFEVADQIKKSLKAIKEQGDELDSGLFTDEIRSLTKDVSKDATVQSKSVEKQVPDIGNKKVSAVLQDEPEFEQISHVKVAVPKLDALMDLTEEIMVSKLQMEALVSDEARLNKVSLEERLKPVVSHMSKLISELQYYVMQVRLVPVEQVFVQFPRMVRDYGKEHNKEINFSVQGQDLELDRTIVDRLGSPLTHLIRNSIDHGIDKQGDVKVIARRERDYAEIIVEDNGMGIQWAKVVDAALKKELIDSESAKTCKENIDANKSMITLLLFDPNLSTNESVTETSGRGVGLAVVKQFVDDIGGSVTVESPVNENGGTKFILKLPISVAIIDVLMAKIADQVIAIPFTSIVRNVLYKSCNIKKMADQDVAIIDGEDIPLIYLDHLFVETSNQNRDSLSRTVIIVENGRQTAGLVVDNLLSVKEIIVKPLPEALEETQGFSGSTILGDGKTVLIVDVVSLIRSLPKDI